MHTTMNQILNLYRSKYPFHSFYELASAKIMKNNALLGENYPYLVDNSSLLGLKFKANPGDIRVDLPIWFGDPSKVKLKVMILGREPRNSHDKFNIEVSNEHNFVFGTPFGIEYWSEKNKYYRSFKNLIKNDEILTYFSDVVKTYEVKQSKTESDLHAKVSFWKKAEMEKDNLVFLKTEVDLLNPDVIIGLGNDSYNFLKKHFKSFDVQKVIHPNARQDKKSGLNAWVTAEIKISEIIKSSKSIA